MDSQVRILIRCPQCGGEIDFLEESFVVHCEYCGSSLLVAGRDRVLRYVLPPRIDDRRTAQQKAIFHLQDLGRNAPRAVETFLFYAPFWRIQGMVFQWIFGRRPMKVPAWGGGPPPTERARVLQTRVLDHSIEGYGEVDLGIRTLGVRSQVLQLRVLSQEDLGERARFLPLEVSLKSVKEQARGLSGFFWGAEDITPELNIHRLIRRRLSVINYPLWYVECRHGGGVETVLVDAVGGTVTKSTDDGSAILMKLMGDAPRKSFRSKELHFLPFRCPNCGWDFPFRPLSLIHLCPTCLQLWTERGGEWKELDYEVIPPPDAHGWEGHLWMPFWRHRAVIESDDGTLKTMGDFYRLAPPSRPVDASSASQRPIYFYMPAARFRNPKVAHKLASQLTRAQPEAAPGVFPKGADLLVAGGSLSEVDVRLMGSVLLGGLIPPRNRRAREFLCKCRIELREPRILYFPFRRLKLFWKEFRTGLSFQNNALSKDLPELTG